MKKAWLILFTLAIIMAASMCAWAGTFDEYWDYEQADGTYAYGFPRIRVSMDKTWYQKTRVVLGEGGATASFYHTDSYNAFAEKGLDGGRLFTIGASVNTDFQNLPSFVYLGFDEEEAMNYYAELPTDYQGYTGDEAIRAEYDELKDGVQDVLDSALIKGSEKFRKLYGAEETDTDNSQRSIIISGDYQYRINEDKKTISIAKYSGKGDVIEIPSEIDGYPVTEIGIEAFRYKKMKSLIIPANIQCIGKQAFEYCVISDMLQLPENVTIKDDAFSYAKLPLKVTIPSGATVEKCAFSYCETLEQVLIDADTLIKGRAFGYCYNLDQVVIAQGSQLKKEAFEYCRKLKKAIFCGNVEAEETAFSYCESVEIIQAKESEYDTWKQTGQDNSKTETVTGGWEASRDASVTKEAQAVFDMAMPDHDRVDYDAVALLATQLVSGTNYCFLCRTNVTDSDEKPSYQLVYIWQDLEGTAHVLEVKDIEFGTSGDTEPSPDDSGEKDLEILGSPASENGVTVTLDKAVAKRIDRGGFEYSFSGTIENNSDEGIMLVIYKFALIDEKGEEYRDFSEVYDGEDKSIPPHTKLDFSHEGIKWGPQSVPASVRIGISSVKTETELPPAVVPKKGEYLYQALGDEKLANIKKEAPAELSFHIDQGGYGRTAVFKEGEALDKAVKLLCDIKIGEETGDWVTDNYNWISIEWKDGSRTGISLNLNNLEYFIHSSPHIYQLEHLKEFWSYASGYLEEDQ